MSICNFVGEKNDFKGGHKNTKFGTPRNSPAARYIAVLCDFKKHGNNRVECVRSSTFTGVLSQGEGDEFEAAVSLLLHTHTHRLAICQAYQ